MKIQWKPFLLQLAIPLAVGGVSGFLIKDSMERYEALAKPPLSPPPVVFPIVWTLLFLCMGVAAYLIAISGSPDRKQALILYGAQLAVNFFWPLIFFNLGFYLTAFFWLLLLLALVLLTAQSFGRICSLAAWLLLPYILWLVFAAYLNFGIFLLNR